MSILFSDVKQSDVTGFFETLRLDGHLDEEDLRANRLVQMAAKKLHGTICVSVQQYRFLTDSNDADADGNHFALMNAYDELAEFCQEHPHRLPVCCFTDRDDVEHGDYFTFTLEVESPC